MALLGSLFGGGGLNTDLDNQAIDLLKGTQTPNVDDMTLELQQLVDQGQLSPEQAQTFLQQQSSMNNISLDPRYKNAQLDALSSLQNIGENNGITATDQAQLNDIQTQNNTAAKGARDAILQNAQARGVGGSGAELLDQLTNAQNSATRSSQQGFDVAANAQQRALAAIQAAGTQAGNMGNTEFGQQAQIANANDAINKFNTQNQQSVQNTNVAANNAAQAANLANKQSIANQNTDIANKQQQYNKELQQQNFNNQMKKNQAVANVLTGTSKAAQDQQNKDDDTARGLIGGGISLAKSGAGAAAASDKNLKENIEEFNPSEFLDNLTSYKYNYKNPKHGEGKQVGVMAQDLEKSAPQMVEDTPEGKMVDYNKAGGPLFASLADLHSRLKKVEGKYNA